jgi:hypothetical protein
MTHEKALELLELEEGASAQEIRTAYQELFNELNIRLTNAPTDHQKQLYTRRLQDIEKAYLLLGGISQDDINELPSIEAVEISEEEQGRQVQGNAKTISTSTITEADALKLLELKIPFSANMLEYTFWKKNRDLEMGMKSAPTEEVRKGFRESIDALNKAHAIILPKAQAKEKKKLPLGILAAVGIVVLLVVVFVWQPWEKKNELEALTTLQEYEQILRADEQESSMKIVKGMRLIKIPGRNYYMGETEVTHGQFEAFINATGYQTTAEKEGSSWVYTGSKFEERNGVTWRNNVSGSGSQPSSHPVIHVSWHDAVAYCNWAGVRLPTSDEWQYAAKGGENHEYAGSNNINEVAWYKENSGNKTHAVKGKKANGYGLYDMSGNVSEWLNTIGGDDNYMEYLGGDWRNEPLALGARHGSADKFGTFFNLGFRVVLSE